MIFSNQIQSFCSNWEKRESKIIFEILYLSSLRPIFHKNITKFPNYDINVRLSAIWYYHHKLLEFRFSLNIVFSSCTVAEIIRRERGSRIIQTMAYIKVQPVIELLLFTELQNRLCRKYGASSLGLLLSPINDIGGQIDPKQTFLIKSARSVNCPNLPKS